MFLSAIEIILAQSKTQNELVRIADTSLYSAIEAKHLENLHKNANDYSLFQTMSFLIP